MELNCQQLDATVQPCLLVLHRSGCPEEGREGRPGAPASTGGALLKQVPGRLGLILCQTVISHPLMTLKLLSLPELLSLNI